jgi:chromosomal replication initiator protein
MCAVELSGQRFSCRTVSAWGAGKVTVKPIEMDDPHVHMRACTVGEIKNSVAYFFGMSLKELDQRSRTQAVAVPRQIAIYLTRQITNASLSEIGREFGGMHYTTVRYSIGKVEQQRKTKEAVELAIRIILENMRC